MATWTEGYIRTLKQDNWKKQNRRRQIVKWEEERASKYNSWNILCAFRHSKTPSHQNTFDAQHIFTFPFRSSPDLVRFNDSFFFLSFVAFFFSLLFSISHLLFLFITDFLYAIHNRNYPVFFPEALDSDSMQLERCFFDFHFRWKTRSYMLS